MSFHKDFVHDCLGSTTGFNIMMSFTVTIFIILLPLYLLVIYLVLQQWRQHHSMSHSDAFVFNMIIMELINLFGLVIFCLGKPTNTPEMFHVATYTFSFNFLGQMFFHLLICLERYLAVVQPVTYLILRKEKGIKIRNTILVSVWLICFALLATVTFQNVLQETVLYCFVVPTLIIMTLCNLNILHVLIRTHPGDRQGWKLAKSKMRAFYIILVIMLVLLLRFGWEILSFKLMCTLAEWEEMCVMLISTVWTSIPTSMELLLLFLYRAKKLLWYKTNVQPAWLCLKICGTK